MAIKFTRFKRLSRYFMAGFFVFAGINHFLNPDFYIPLIPPYIPWPETVNWVSGLVEIILGFGLFFEKTRRAAAGGVILLMLLFIPTHIYFIQIGSCIPDLLCTPQWLGWVRLVIIHPLLVLWAWWHRLPD